MRFGRLSRRTSALALVFFSCAPVSVREHAEIRGDEAHHAYRDAGRQVLSHDARVELRSARQVNKIAPKPARKLT